MTGNKLSFALKVAPWVTPLKFQVAAWGVQKMAGLGMLKGVATALRGIAGKVGGRIAGAMPGGGLIKTTVAVGRKLANRVGRKNLKRAATAALGAIGAGGVVAGVRKGRGGGGGVMGGVDAQGNLVGFGGGRRRINPGNVRAMRRAIRRVEMGARLYSKMFRISRGKSIKGAPGVKIVKFHRKAA